MVISKKQNKNSILNHLNILYIEDENNIRENISSALKIVVNDVFDVGDIHSGLEILKNKRIDLIISDINLPKINGINFVKKLRESNYNLPIILLTAYTEKEYLLEATKLKLVDYLVKPIDFNILKEALYKACEDILSNGMFIVDFKENISYNVMHKKLYSRPDEKEIDLTAKEINLLDYLIKNHTRVISHDEIKIEIWEDSFEATDSALKNLLNKLRKKIGKETIKNISGVGFKIQIN